MPGPGPSSGPRPATVVIVDDLADIRRLLVVYLGLDDPELVLVEASGGRQGLELVEAHQPEVVVVDLAMPDIDGFEVITRVRQLSPATRVVVYSAFPALSMRNRARELGAAEYHEKSDPVERVAATVHRLVAAARQSGARCPY